MLSVIIQEHNEDPSFVRKMMDQVEILPVHKELLLVSSKPVQEVINMFGPFNHYSYNVRVFGGVDSCAGARNTGAINAAGKDLLFMDCHVCITPENYLRVQQTLNQHPDALVGPSLASIEFPSCDLSEHMGKGHGVAFRFVDTPFEWTWIPATQHESEFAVPFLCGCAFMMKKDTFNHLNMFGGFLDYHTGLSWEEEVSMRAARIGHPSIVEPRATFGHLYKGYEGHPKWDEHSTSGYYKTRAIGAYINVFDPVLWSKIDRLAMNVWGDEWVIHLAEAQRKFTWLKKQLEPYKNSIDENWFLRTY